MIWQIGCVRKFHHVVLLMNFVCFGSFSLWVWNVGSVRQFLSVGSACMTFFVLSTPKNANTLHTDQSTYTSKTDC